MKTKLEDYDVPRNTKVIELRYNKEVVCLVTLNTYHLKQTLKTWFENEIADWYNNPKNEDLLFYLTNYLNDKNLLAGWRVYHFNNIQKEMGFDITIGEDGYICVNYFENVKRIEAWF